MSRQRVRKKDLRSSYAFFLYELVVGCGLIIGLCAGGYTLFAWCERWALREATRHIGMICQLLSQCAQYSGKEARLTLVESGAAYRWHDGEHERSGRLPLFVSWGAPKGVKGPPSNPKYGIKNSATGGCFDAQGQRYFSWGANGSGTPGTLYLKTFSATLCGAVTVPCSAYAQVRTYQLSTDGWIYGWVV